MDALSVYLPYIIGFVVSWFVVVGGLYALFALFCRASIAVRIAYALWWIVIGVVLIVVPPGPWAGWLTSRNGMIAVAGAEVVLLAILMMSYPRSSRRAVAA